MEIIDNINKLLGDSLKQEITPGTKLKIAASCFSIYAYEALKKQLESLESLEFIFTSPTFIPDEVTDKVRKERREFQIPKAERERSFYGSEFEIQLKNKLTQKAIAKECADWMLRKATFRSNIFIKDRFAYDVICHTDLQRTSGESYGRDMQAYSALRDQAISSMVDLKEDNDLDSLFSGDRTTALVDTIAGLDDFELINFLVVQERV